MEFGKYTQIKSQVQKNGIWVAVLLRANIVNVNNTNNDNNEMSDRILRRSRQIKPPDQLQL